MNRPDNARSQNTRQKIEDAYLELLNENPDHMVTVAELCRKISINRTTFYFHYADIADLHTSLMEKSGKAIISILSDKSLGESWLAVPKLCALLGYVKSRKAFYKACYSTGIMDESNVIDILVERKKITSAAQRMQTLFDRAGTNAVVKDWLLRDCEESPEEMAECLRKIYRC